MDNQPSIDREILIPILVTGFSVVGIIAVLFIGRSRNSPVVAPTTASATPFEYIYLGTEPVLSTPLIEESGIAPTEPFPIEETPFFFTSTPLSISTPIILTQPNSINTLPGAVQRTNTPLPSPTSASGPPLIPGTYDAVDSGLIKTGWTQTPVAGAHGGTLHVSQSPGSTISFRFIGTQLRLIYQGGPTLGQMTISIDNQTDTLPQSSGNEWASTIFASGTHTVLISHVGGGSVNLDSVIILDTSTATPPTTTGTPGTATPTLTPSQTFTSTP
jgi:hypothetical protein